MMVEALVRVQCGHAHVVSAVKCTDDSQLVLPGQPPAC